MTSSAGSTSTFSAEGDEHKGEAPRRQLEISMRWVMSRRQMDNSRVIRVLIGAIEASLPRRCKRCRLRSLARSADTIEAVSPREAF